MGDNTILTPGMTGAQECSAEQKEQDTQYLVKDNYLGEFENEVEKSLALENLGAYPKSKVYTKTEADIASQTAIKEALQQHLNSEDPHGIIPQIQNELEGVVKQDGSTPFVNPQTGVDPISDFHLTTKRFVQKLINDHLSKEDPHNIVSKVEDILTNYVKLSQVYLKNQVYTTQEIDSKLGSFLRKDGTTPFIKPQMGVDPTLDSHLSTKRYVDQIMWKHLADIDPHGFISTLNKRLANYYKKSETYSKAETYSRIQIDTIIRSLVMDAAREAIEEHINQFDPHNILSEIRKEGYVKQDGSTPFKNPQKGVPGQDPNDLVVLEQLQEIEKQIPVWITSGPIQTTVGFMEDNSNVPPKMTFQEVMDAIFYGKTIDVKSPPTAYIGDTVIVDMYVRGSGLISHAFLYQNDELIATLQPSDFDLGHAQAHSLPITSDTTFKFVVFYVSGTSLEVSCKTLVSYGVFVGLLPKWYTGANVTYDYLLELIQEDPINNKMYGENGNLYEINHKYSFEAPELKHFFVALPKSYNDLVEMSTKSQQVGIQAFDVISDIPLNVPNKGDVIYKFYIYSEALVAFDTEVTFKFGVNE